jgi:uncharacterized protein (UPF0332 family)
MSRPSEFEEKTRLFHRTAALAASAGDDDSAISRCCYAMFLMAEAALLTVGVSAACRRGVSTAFSKHFVARGPFSRAVGKSLRRMFELRLRADCDAMLVSTAAEAERAPADAPLFADTLTAYLRSGNPEPESGT